MRINFIYKIVIILLFALAPGCKRHREYTLQRITQHSGTIYKETQQGISVIVKPLAHDEVYELFGSDLQSKGFQPLYIEIYNGSQEPYFLSSRCMSAPLASDAFVKDQLYWPTTTITWVSSLIAAVYFWPAIPVVIIPSAYWCSSSNSDLDRFMQEYSLKAHERSFALFPQETLKKICFIYGWEASASFELGLTSDKGRTIKFLVHF